jgi:hypothetical protein
MTDDDLGPHIPRERAAVVAWKLAVGQRLTTHQIADLCRISHRGALALIVCISRVIPVWCDEQGQWQRISPSDSPCAQRVPRL